MCRHLESLLFRCSMQSDTIAATSAVEIAKLESEVARLLTLLGGGGGGGREMANKVTERVEAKTRAGAEERANRAKAEAEVRAQVGLAEAEAEAEAEVEVEARAEAEVAWGRAEVAAVVAKLNATLPAADIAADAAAVQAMAVVYSIDGCHHGVLLSVRICHCRRSWRWWTSSVARWGAPR